jgi:hypothetical protein
MMINPDDRVIVRGLARYARHHCAGARNAESSVRLRLSRPKLGTSRQRVRSYQGKCCIPRPCPSICPEIASRLRTFALA